MSRSAGRYGRTYSVLGPTHFNDVKNEVAVLQTPTPSTTAELRAREGQPGRVKGQVKQSSVRVTWQVTPRNKIAGTC